MIFYEAHHIRDAHWCSVSHYVYWLRAVICNRIKNVLWIYTYRVLKVFYLFRQPDNLNGVNKETGYETDKPTPFTPKCHSQKLVLDILHLTDCTHMRSLSSQTCLREESRQKSENFAIYLKGYLLQLNSFLQRGVQNQLPSPQLAILHTETYLKS